MTDHSCSRSLTDSKMPTNGRHLYRESHFSASRLGHTLRHENTKAGSCRLCSESLVSFHTGGRDARCSAVARYVESGWLPVSIRLLVLYADGRAPSDKLQSRKLPALVLQIARAAPQTGPPR